MNYLLFFAFFFIGLTISLLIPMLAIAVKRLVGVVKDRQILVTVAGAVFIFIQLMFGLMYALTGFTIMSFFAPFLGDRLAGLGTGIALGSILGLIFLLTAKFGPSISDQKAPAKSYIVILLGISALSLRLGVVFIVANTIF